MMVDPVQQNQVLLLGQDPRLRALVGKAAGQARQQLRADGMLDPAQPVLQADDPPLAAIVVNMDEPDIDEVTVAVRSRAELAKIPMIGVTQQTNDLIFAEAFGHGMDDCCGFDEQALVRRLRHVGDGSVGRFRRTKALSLLTAMRRTVFSSGGFSKGQAIVMFAVSAEEALSMSTDDRVRRSLSQSIDEKGCRGIGWPSHLRSGGRRRRAASRMGLQHDAQGIPGMLGRLGGAVGPNGRPRCLRLAVESVVRRQRTTESR